MSSDSPKRVLLLGASVGYAWNLPEWPERMKKKGFVIEMMPYYSFNKSEALEEVLMRPRRKFRLTRTYLKGFFKPKPQLPSVIFFKECAAYFPRDLEKDKLLIRKWIDRCRAAGITPAVTTVVPVTKEHAAKKPGRLQGILEYNDWINDFAKEYNIPCLDLEKAVKVSAADRSLRDELTSGDGLHLNNTAYNILDIALNDFLELQIF